MNSITIVSPGMFTTVQDLGRMEAQRFGMPAAGVMDPFAAKAANLLVGNDPREGVLEATAMGPVLVFEANTAIAVTGGNLSPALDGSPIPMWRTVEVKKGMKLSFARLASGFRAYIAFSGGIDVAQVMESKSTYVKGGVGGYEGRGLKAGDILKLGKGEAPCHRFMQEEAIPVYEKESVIRVVLGPQETYFSKKGLDSFLNTPYTVCNESDRMGYRLSGEKIQHILGSDIISDGIIMGSIQVPGNGLPIILMADRQTAGGYPKIATVISSDLSKIAQAKPGDIFHFWAVSIEEAQKIAKEKAQLLETVGRTC